MPKIKKESSPKKTVKKTVKTTRKKSATKTTAQKKKKTSLPKAKPITIDVIADDEEILSRQGASTLPEDNVEEREGMDVQKKFFSDLVAEIKDKKDGSTFESDLPFPEGKIARKNKAGKSLGLYRRIATQFIVIIAIFLLAIAYFFLPSLKISLYPAAEAVVDTLSFQVVSSANNIDNTNVSHSITGQLRSIPIKAEKVYKASGEEVLGEEIIGEVTLHNEYNKAQPLVVKTRLLSPDNKLFRIKNAVTVPAGGSVKVPIYADQVSAEMAIAPTRFTIPGLWVGLQDKIYATSDKAFEYRHQIKYYVRQRDLDQAMNDIKETLATKAEATIKSLNISSQALAYTLDKDATTLDIGAKLGEESSEFAVSASNNISLAFFSKAQAEALVKAKLAFLLPDDKKLSHFNADDIVYRLDSFDKADDSATVTASFRASMSLRTDADIIDRKKLVNLNRTQISEYLKAFPEIASFNLEFFPSFMKRAPSLADRIKVEVVQ